MDRRGFLRRGAVTAAVVAVAPVVAAEVLSTPAPNMVSGTITFSPAKLDHVVHFSDSGWYYFSEQEAVRKAMLELERKIWFDEM